MEQNPYPYEAFVTVDPQSYCKPPKRVALDSSEPGTDPSLELSDEVA